MTDIYQQLSESEQLGRDVLIEKKFPRIYVTKNNQVYCYTGAYPKNKPTHEIGIDIVPWDIVGKHSTDEKVSKNIEGFFRISKGIIYLDRYIDETFNSVSVKQAERWIRFPSVGEHYFGVINKDDESEDEVLTREVFGLTYDEIMSIIKSYIPLFGTDKEYIQLPALTRSTHRSNYCDITGAWIPSGYPYITFENGDIPFSHVSLGGFYIYIRLLINRDTKSAAARLLIENGAYEQALKEIIKMAGQSKYGLTQVTESLFESKQQMQ